MTIAKRRKNKKLMRLKIKVKQRFLFKTLNPNHSLGFNNKRQLQQNP